MHIILLQEVLRLLESKAQEAERLREALSSTRASSSTKDKQIQLLQVPQSDCL